MNAMTDRVFADTNLIIYTESNDHEKTGRAIAILQDAPVISTQVVNEAINVLTKKYAFQLWEAHEIAESLLDLCEVVPVEVATIRKAIDLAKRYSLSHWDSLIVAAALLADCQTLYSEDFQHGQLFDNQLTIQNPFSLNP
jgi:predicted nucleic acid-binding protein